MGKRAPSPRLLRETSAALKASLQTKSQGQKPERAPGMLYARLEVQGYKSLGFKQS